MSLIGVYLHGLKKWIFADPLEPANDAYENKRRVG